MYSVKFWTDVWRLNIITHPEATFIKARWDFDWDKLFLYSLNDDLWFIVAKWVLAQAWRKEWLELRDIDLNELKNVIEEVKWKWRINKYIIAKEVEKWWASEEIDDFTISISRSASLLAKDQINIVQATNRSLNIIRNILWRANNELADVVTKDDFVKAIQRIQTRQNDIENFMLNNLLELWHTNKYDRWLRTIVENVEYKVNNLFEEKFKDFDYESYLSNGIFDESKRKEFTNNVVKLVWNNKLNDWKKINKFIKDLNSSLKNNNKIYLDDFKQLLIKFYKENSYDEVNSIDIVKSYIEEMFWKIIEPTWDKLTFTDIKLFLDENNKNIVNWNKVKLLKWQVDFNRIDIFWLVRKLNNKNITWILTYRNFEKFTDEDIKKFKDLLKELEDWIKSEKSLISRANMTNLTLDFWNSWKINFPDTWLDDVLKDSWFVKYTDKEKKKQHAILKEDNLWIFKDIVREYSIRYNQDLEFWDVNPLWLVGGSKSINISHSNNLLLSLNNIMKVSTIDSFLIEWIIKSEFFKNIKVKALDKQWNEIPKNLSNVLLNGFNAKQIRENYINQFLKEDKAWLSTVYKINNFTNHLKYSFVDALLRWRYYNITQDNNYFGNIQELVDLHEFKEVLFFLKENAMKSEFKNLINDIIKKESINSRYFDNRWVEFVKNVVKAVERLDTLWKMKDILTIIKNNINKLYTTKYWNKTADSLVKEFKIEWDKEFRKIYWFDENKKVIDNRSKVSILSYLEKDYDDVKYSLLTWNYLNVNVQKFFNIIEERLNSEDIKDYEKFAIWVILKTFSTEEMKLIKQFNWNKLYDIFWYLSNENFKNFLLGDVDVQVQAFNSYKWKWMFAEFTEQRDFVNEVIKRRWRQMTKENLLEFLKNVKEEFNKPIETKLEDEIWTLKLEAQTEILKQDEVVKEKKKVKERDVKEIIEEYSEDEVLLDITNLNNNILEWLSDETWLSIEYINQMLENDRELYNAYLLYKKWFITKNEYYTIYKQRTFDDLWVWDVTNSALYNNYENWVLKLLNDLEVNIDTKLEKKLTKRYVENIEPAKIGENLRFKTFYDNLWHNYADEYLEYLRAYKNHKNRYNQLNDLWDKKFKELLSKEERKEVKYYKQKPVLQSFKQFVYNKYNNLDLKLRDWVKIETEKEFVDLVDKYKKVSNTKNVKNKVAEQMQLELDIDNVLEWVNWNIGSITSDINIRNTLLEREINKVNNSILEYDISKKYLNSIIENDMNKSILLKSRIADEELKATNIFNNLLDENIEKLQKELDLLKSKDDSINNINMSDEVTNFDNSLTERYKAQIKTDTEIKEEDEWRIVQLYWYWNQRTADAVADDLRWRANLLKNIYSLNYMDDIKSKYRELFDTINWYSYVVWTDMDFLVKQRTLYNKMAEIINSKTIWWTEEVTWSYLYRTLPVYDKKNKWYNSLINAFTDALTHWFKWANWRYVFDEKLFMNEFDSLIKTDSVLKWEVTWLTDEELNSLEEYYKTTWWSYSFWEYYKMKIFTDKQFLDVFQEYKDDIITKVLWYLNKVDDAFWESRNIVSKYKWKEKVSNIIEDVVWTMKGDWNMALIDLWIHKKDNFIKVLQDKWFSNKHANIIYSFFVEWDKHIDDYLWKFINTLSYSAKYWIWNMLTLAWTVAWLQQAPWQWTDIRSKLKVYWVNYNDLVQLQNRYNIVSDENTLVFANSIWLQNDKSFFITVTKLNYIVDKMLTSWNTSVAKSWKALRSLIDAWTNPLWFNDHYFDVERRLAWLSRAMYNSWYKSYDEVINWINSLWNKELLRLQWEARHYYNELGWWVSSKSSIYKKNKVFNRTWNTNLNDEWYSLFSNPIMWAFKRFYENIWWYMTAWGVNKFNNVFVTLPQMFVQWLKNWDEEVLKVVAKEVWHRALNTLYIWLLWLKLDKFQDEDVRTNKNELVELLHNDLVAFMSLFSPVLKTLRMYDQNDYDMLSWAWLLSYNMADRFMNSPAVLWTLANAIYDEYNNRNFEDKEWISFLWEFLWLVYDSFSRMWKKSFRYNHLIDTPYDTRTEEQKFSLSYLLWFWEQSDKAVKVNDVWAVASDYKLYSNIFEQEGWERTLNILKWIFGWKSEQWYYSQEIAKRLNDYTRSVPLYQSIKNSEMDINNLFYEVLNNERYFKNWINETEQEQNKNNVLFLYDNYFRKWFPDKNMQFDWTSLQEDWTVYNMTQIESYNHQLVLDIFEKAKSEYVLLWAWEKESDFWVFYYNKLLEAWVLWDNATLPTMNYYLYNSLVNKYSYEIYKEVFSDNRTQYWYPYKENNFYFDEDWKSLPKDHKYKLTAIEWALREMWQLLNNDRVLNSEILRWIMQMDNEMQTEIYNRTWNYLDLYQHNADESIVDEKTWKTKKEERLEALDNWKLKYTNKYINKEDKQSNLWFKYLNATIEKAEKDNLVKYSDKNRISPYLWAFTYTDIYWKNAIMKLLDTDEKKEVVFQYLALTSSHWMKELMWHPQMKEFIKNNQIDEELVNYLYTVNDELTTAIEKENPKSVINNWKPKWKYSKYSDYKPFNIWWYKNWKATNNKSYWNWYWSSWWNYYAWADRNPLQQFIYDNRDKLSANPYETRSKLDALQPLEIEPSKASVYVIQWKIFNLVLPTVSFKKFIQETWQNNYWNWKIPLPTIINKKQKKLNLSDTESKSNVKTEYKKTKTTWWLWNWPFNIID